MSAGKTTDHVETPPIGDRIMMHLGNRSTTSAEFAKKAGWIVFVLIQATLANHVRAQDWKLKRDPCSEDMLARYYSMLERNPNDRFPMKKLRECRSAEALIKRYESRVEARPRWYEGRVILGHLYLSVKQLEKAVVSYKKSIEINKKAADPHFALGNLYRRMKKPAEALESYDRALKLAQSDSLKKRILRSQIDLSMNRKDMDKARSYFNKLLELDPKDVNLRSEFARMLVRNLNYKAALKEYAVLIDQARGNTQRRASLMMEVGEVYERMGQDTNAIETYRRAKKLIPRGHWLRRELIDKVISIFRRRGDIRSLAVHYEKTWKARGVFEWQILAQLYEELGEQDKAVDSYKRALASSASAVDIRDKLISLLERAGRHDDAQAELEKQVRLAPGEPRYMLRLAERYWRAGKRKAALSLLRQCGNRFPNDGSVQIALADLYSRWSRPDLALRQYQILVRIEPDDPGHIISLGEQYWQRGDKSRALSTWKALLRPNVFPSRDEAYAALGEVYANHDMIPQGLQMYQTALKISPGNPAIYRALGPLYLRARNYDKAVESWEKVIELAVDPEKRAWRREARTSIIKLWHSQRRLEKKLASYEKRFRSPTPDVEAGYFLGEAYIKLERLDEAEGIFKAILEADSLQHEAMLALQDIYRQQHRFDKAIEILKKLAEALPGRSGEFYMRIAELALLAYKDEMALDFAKKALKTSEGDAHGWARIAAIYEKKEDYESAINAYKKALEIRPRFFNVHFELAKIYLRRGQHLEASDLYHEVVRMSPDEHIVGKAGRQAVELDEYIGRLHVLERELIPLAFTYTHKPVYRELLVRIYSRMIPALVRRAEHAESQTERDRARDQLVDIGSRAMKPLLESLSTGSWNDKLETVGLLGHLGNPGAAPTLVRLALNPPLDEDDSIGLKPSDTGTAGAAPPTTHEKRRKLEFRVRALVSAGRLSNPATTKDLLKLLRNEEAAVRETAAWALVLMAGPGMYGPFLEILEDRKVGVQVMACLGLGLANPRSLKHLLSAAQDERRREEVRSACALAAGFTGNRQGVEQLLDLMGRGRSMVQHKAAIALGMLADSNAVGPLLRLYWTRRGDMRNAARWALLQSVAGERSSMDISALRNLELDGSDRLPLVQYISKLGSVTLESPEESRSLLIRNHESAIVEGLKTAVTRHRDVVMDVIRELNSHPRRFSLGSIEPRAKDRIPEDILKEIEQIGQLLKPDFITLSTHQDPEIRATAISLIGKTGQREDMVHLERAIEDKSPGVRKAAIHAAVLMSDRDETLKHELADLLVNSFEAVPWEEGREIATALGRMKALRAEPFLLKARENKNGFVAEAAIRSLGELRTKTSERALISALFDAIEPIRTAAAETLAGVRSREAIRALEKAAQSDPSPRVRKAAASALK